MSQRLSRRDVARAVAAGLLDDPRHHSQWVQRLAAHLVAQRQTDQADLYINDIAHELQVQAGLLTVEVVSARHLATEVRTALSKLLQQQTGANAVALHETTDQNLLGGFVARTADAEIDASVRTKLKKLASLA
jgi:F-type H+-transporting ATPase subunit delta